MLTDLPMGAWTMASALDMTSGGTMPKASERLVGLGILTAVPAALSGASDWSESYGKEQRLGFAHALGNSVGTTFQIASWVSRRCGHHRTGVGLSLAGLAATMWASYLGGHLSFGMGVGVDHTAFQKTVTKWVDVAAEDEVTEGELLRVDANNVPVMLTRHKGQLKALSATAYMPGTLNKGRIENDCVVCPWHNSRFRLTDGAPVRGPAAMRQPTWDIHMRMGESKYEALPKRSRHSTGDLSSLHTMPLATMCHGILKQVAFPGRSSKYTSDFEYKGHTRRASADEPQYEIKSDKTEHIAAHKGSALRKVSRSG